MWFWASLLVQYPTDPLIRHTFFSRKKEYKKLTRELKRQFENAMLDRIENLPDNNPKEISELNKITSIIRKNK